MEHLKRRGPAPQVLAELWTGLFSDVLGLNFGLASLVCCSKLMMSLRDEL